jgi:hypothetical protein
MIVTNINPNKRRNQMNTYTTIKSIAVGQIARLVEQYLAPINGRKDNRSQPMEEQISWGSMYMEFERAWGVGITASIALTPSYKSSGKKDGEADWFYDLEFQATWSSTGRNLDEAQGSVDLYNEVLVAMRAVKLGCEALGKIIPDPKEEETIEATPGQVKEMEEQAAKDALAKLMT